MPGPPADDAGDTDAAALADLRGLLHRCRAALVVGDVEESERIAKALQALIRAQQAFDAWAALVLAATEQTEDADRADLERRILDLVRRARREAYRAGRDDGGREGGREEVRPVGGAGAGSAS